MYYQKLLTLACCLLLMISCRKQPDCEKPAGLYGEWIWEKSIGGFGGWTDTPESTKLNKRLVIDDYMFREYINDSLAFESEYNLEISEEVLVGTEEKTYIEFKKGGAKAIVTGSSKLELFDQCFDCFAHTYKRKVK